MKYKIEMIPDLPFRKTYTRDNGKQGIVQSDVTVKVTSLDNILDVRFYAYKPMIEHYNSKILDKELILDYCYVEYLSLRACDIQSISAKDAFFDNKVDLSDAEIKGAVHIENSIFKGEVYFTRTKFDNQVDIRKTIFSSDTFFNEAIFSERTWIRETKFEGIVDFGSSIFRNLIRFDDVEFLGEAFFILISFEGRTIFNDVVVYKGIGINSTKFSSETQLHFKHCHGFSINNCTILESCEIQSTEGFDKFSIKACKIIGQLFIPLNNNLKQAIKNNKNFTDRDKAQEFSFLKNNYNRNGEYDYEDQVYVEYRRCMRETKNKIIYVLDWLFLDIFSCYFTKPFRILFLMLVMIILYAGIYSIPSVIDFSDCYYHGVNGGVYHSIITFFTIGFGDSTPVGSLGLLLTGLEGFTGVFLVTLFSITLGHKVWR